LPTFVIVHLPTARRLAAPERDDIALHIADHIQQSGTKLIFGDWMLVQAPGITLRG